MIETALRIGFSLVVILMLMWGLAKVARRPLAGRSGDLLTVVARQQLTRNSSVAVLQVADRALVVGITDHQVTLLTETDAAALLKPADAPAAEKRSTVRLVSESPQVQPESSDLSATAAVPSGRLAGSVLSPQTWSATIEFLRSRTARK